MFSAYETFKNENKILFILDPVARVSRIPATKHDQANQIKMVTVPTGIYIHLQILYKITNPTLQHFDFCNKISYHKEANTSHTDRILLKHLLLMFVCLDI